MPIWTEGDTEAEIISDELAKNRRNRYRIQQRRIKPGDDVLVRLITDRARRGDHPGWITAGMHFVPTKEQPADFTGKWPKAMWGICRNDRIFRLPDPSDPRKRLDEYEDGYGDCYICEAFRGIKDETYKTDLGIPSAQVWGLAVMREPVRDPENPEKGPVIGFRDRMVEWTDDKGNSTQVPEFVILSQKYRNFWGAISAACYVGPQTATDKDWRITRKDNDYTISVVNSTPDHMVGTASWQVYEDALKMMGFTLGGYLLEHASADHYNRWFVPGAEPEGGYGRRDSSSGGDATAAPPGSAPSAPVIDQAAMESFRSSLQVRK